MKVGRPCVYPSSVLKLPNFIQPGDAPACREKGVDPAWFFPRRNAHEAVAKARAVCHTCLLEEACADWAADVRVRYGVWGGLTPRQLDQRRKCRTGTCLHPEHATRKAAA